MKRTTLLLLSLAALLPLSLVFTHLAQGAGEQKEMPLFEADDKNIQYTGRIDFTDPKKPKFWSPGVYVQAKFQGTAIEAVVNDQVLWGRSHNYIEIAIDDQKPFRVQTTGPSNTIEAATGLTDGPHTITVCKDTEAGIGYLEFVGFRCAKLLSPPRKPKHKLEFIGDSITCGTGSDQSVLPCGKGEWYDQHNAYLSYGPTTARALNAQWQLTSVSGIGLMHSCCDMKTTMPDVFDKTNLSDNTLPWDFKRYQPDAVTVCLGQNDGMQEPAAFQANYIKFLGQVRSAYPKAQIICLNSPMGDAKLTDYLKENLTQIAETMHQHGDQNVHAFFFARQYNGGCGGHPDLADHQLIAAELTTYLKSQLHW